MLAASREIWLSCIHSTLCLRAQLDNVARMIGRRVLRLYAQVVPSELRFVLNACYHA